MIFQFTAMIVGGRGENIWDKEITVSGENMTFRQALDAVEPMAQEAGGIIIVLAQDD